MSVRSRYLLAAALGLAAWQALPAQEPARLGVPDAAATPSVSSNQRIAATIADQLRQNGHLQGYTVHILFQDGLAELTGSVADQTQRDEVLRIVQGVPGVARVRDRLIVTAQQGLTPVQASEPIPLPRKAEGDGPRPEEPLPVYQGGPNGQDLHPPKMPPYAWPTYAPYNNYSRVAYPLGYPYEAWPFIGPCYPFPKVPLGWRSVKLTWEDGYWWYGKIATPHDWWRLRYW